MLQEKEELINHYELAASDAQEAWQHSHQSDMSGRRLALQQAQRLVRYSMREQEAARVAAERLEHSERDAEQMMQQASAYLGRQSQELQEAVRMRDRFTEERMAAEQKFSATLAGLANAAEENRVQKGVHPSLGRALCQFGPRQQACGERGRRILRRGPPGARFVAELALRTPRPDLSAGRTVR
jgi:hypothetical protein